MKDFTRINGVVWIYISTSLSPLDFNSFIVVTTNISHQGVKRYLIRFLSSCCRNCSFLCSAGPTSAEYNFSPQHTHDTIVLSKLDINEFQGLCFHSLVRTETSYLLRNVYHPLSVILCLFLFNYRFRIRFGRRCYNNINCVRCWRRGLDTVKQYSYLSICVDTYYIPQPNSNIQTTKIYF